jgi:hypothetical protein
MASYRQDLYSSTQSGPRTAATSKNLHPEFSDDPVLSPHSSKKARDRSYLSPGDTRVSGELNLSTNQTSTQNSLHLKRSYFLSSAKRSEPDPLSLTQPKLDDPADRYLTLRLEDKLKELDLQPYRKSEVVHTESFFAPSPDPAKYATEEAMENGIVFEGERDVRIPQLKWCASCKAEVATEVLYVNNEKTFWSSVGIFLSGGFLGCFLLPYMMNSCKGAKVICHKCRRVLM